MPGEFRTLVRAVAEKSGDFNKRLRAACESAPITSFEAAVVDGQPVVTLISEVDLPSPGDIVAAKEAGEILKADELIPIDDTICVQIAGLGASGEGAAMSEKVMDALNERAGGDCIEVRYFSGQFVQWVADANDKSASPKSVLATVPITFAAVVYLQEPEMADAAPVNGKK